MKMILTFFTCLVFYSFSFCQTTSPEPKSTLNKVIKELEPANDNQQPVIKEVVVDAQAKRTILKDKSGKVYLDKVLVSRPARIVKKEQ